MTHQELFDNLAEDVQKALLENYNTAWDDFRVEYNIQDPFHPGYVIVVWGEELKNNHSDIQSDDSKCFSVAIHRRNDAGVPAEMLCATTSESPDLQDLEAAVYAALRQLEHYHFQSQK